MVTIGRSADCNSTNPITMRQVYAGVDWLFVTEAHTFKALRSIFYVAENLCFGKVKAVVAFSAIS